MSMRDYPLQAAIRDRPASCTCGWEWKLDRYVRVPGAADPGCIWHCGSIPEER